MFKEIRFKRTHTPASDAHIIKNTYIFIIHIQYSCCTSWKTMCIYKKRHRPKIKNNKRATCVCVCETREKLVND